jgi:signal peptide peptidase SppA
VKPAVIDAIRSEVLAIHPPALEALVARLDAAADASTLEVASRMFGGGAESRVRRHGDAAHVPVRGVLVRGKVDPWVARYFGVSGYDDIRDDLAEALADDGVKAIVLDIDSPGGSAAGLAALADHIREARKTKRVDAFVSGMAASAGYFIAAQAERVVSEKDAIIGSIGTFARVVDSSEAYAREGLKVHVLASGPHKGMGTPGTPVTPAQIAMHQAVINDFAAVFIEAVATGRGLERDRVQALATGAHWLAPAALELGLVDAIGGVATLRNPTKRGGARAEDDPMSTPNASTTTTPAAPAPAPAPTPAPAPAPVAPQAATLDELEARFGGEPAFVVAQLKAKATIDQAERAFLQLKLERAEKDKAALQAQLAAAPKAAAPAPAPKPSGVEPLAGNTTATPETPLAKHGDFVTVARERAREKGISYTQAADQIAAEQPELHAAYVDRQHDETRNRQRRSKAKA